MTINKDKRENSILEEIVKLHISSAFPVGSKQISKTLGLSSATIRNVMHDLEEKGFVKQPHTSAGRVPTDLGYRRYVDSMMHVRELNEDEILDEVKSYLNEKRFFEEFIESLSCAASHLTHYTSLAFSPNNKLYFDGTYRMLEQPEFRELDFARDFLRIIEEKTELMEALAEDLDRETTIRIGRENAFDELRECTIITSTYKFKNNKLGSIGIIGPMRMKYEEIVPIVRSIAELTTEVLGDISI